MELREYFRIIGRYWKLFWGVVIIFSVGAYLFSAYQPKTYLASTSATVNKGSAVTQSQVNYYLYDNYYNVQSSLYFSQIVVSWFSSPAVIKEVYDKAEVPVPAISQSKLPKMFKTIRQEPATINISTVNASRDDAEKLVNAAAEVMQEKSNELGRTDKENVYDIVKFGTIVTDNKADVALNTIIGLIIGVLLGAVLSLGVEYFRKK
jgi:capsular polysaccharide biosynthesis protein